ncbi:MAG TPA: MarR family transcriptional regulator [Actinophytocola sp.]|uniref:GbsR/MarR family transcriptional regulator n=1 Tax=Actinophytocola sp. TaxID=1872138 RepID=UPI002DDDAFAC|nr:MarR family transcriptional regulator [Actinophytocola sp.]HEV2782316.1 MarR family transcriptional regulator [Actinophytocola sp.]
MTSRDDEAVARFVERFGLIMAESGIPRMPARVLARLLVIDSAKATAAELAESLQISPAAVSGAVRYLVQVGLVRRARDPGERRDHYEVPDDVWFTVYSNRDKMFDAYTAVLSDGVAAVGEETPAGHRLDMTRRFFEYLRKELPAVTERFRALEYGSESPATPQRRRSE